MPARPKSSARIGHVQSDGGATGVVEVRVSAPAAATGALAVLRVAVAFLVVGPTQSKPGPASATASSINSSPSTADASSYDSKPPMWGSLVALLDGNATWNGLVGSGTLNGVMAM